MAQTPRLSGTFPPPACGISCNRPKTGFEGGSAAAARAVRPQPADSLPSAPTPYAPAGPVQEPDHPDPALRRRALVLPARPDRCRHHPGDRPGQRPARLLAGARRRRRRGEAAGHGAGQGHGAARRQPGRDPAGGDRARRRRRALRRATSSRGLPDPGVQGPVRRRGHADRRDLPGGEDAGRSAGGHAARPARPTRCSWARTWSAARPRRSSCAPGRDTEFGKISERLQAAAAGDGVRARRPALRLLPDGSHAGAGDRHLRHQRLPRTARCWTPSCSRWRWPSG